MFSMNILADGLLQKSARQRRRSVLVRLPDGTESRHRRHSLLSQLLSRERTGQSQINGQLKNRPWRDLGFNPASPGLGLPLL